MHDIIDISVPLHPDMPVWPGNAGLSIVPLKRMAAGDKGNLSALECGLHTGTHVDAPWHFVEDSATVEQLSLDTLLGHALVAHLPGADTVTAATLDGLALPEAIGVCECGCVLGRFQSHCATSCRSLRGTTINREVIGNQ